MVVLPEDAVGVLCECSLRPCGRPVLIQHSYGTDYTALTLVSVRNVYATWHSFSETLLTQRHSVAMCEYVAILPELVLMQSYVFHTLVQSYSIAS